MGDNTRSYDRFWAKVDMTGDCWVWSASLNRYGYGQFRIGGRETSPVMAHRHAYELLVGPIPPRQQIDHLCRNRACVNPAHLDPVPQSVNLQREAAAQPRRTHCAEGHWLDDGNTYRYGGTTVCRRCKIAYAAARKRATRPAA
jgi:hypothetical protein